MLWPWSCCLLQENRANMCNSSHGSSTHIIMEGFCFAGVVTCLSSLWRSTIQVPEYTADKTGQEETEQQWTQAQTSPGHVYREQWIWLLTTTMNVGIQEVLQVLCSSPIGSREGGIQIETERSGKGHLLNGFQNHANTIHNPCYETTPKQVA